MADSTQALDRLQREINSIFEQVGRLLAASSKSDAGVTLARAARLKQQYPAAELRFHEALDVLDAELQHAKTVLRRDLAVSRDKEGLQIGAPATAQVVAQAPSEKAPLEEVVDVSAEPMSDIKPQSSEAIAEPGKQLLAELDEVKPKSSPSQTEAMDSSSVKAEEVEPKLEIDTAMKSTDAKDDQQDSNDVPPDTATMSVNADLDSLFNDPMSAGGQGSGPGTAFDDDINGNGDFDFASFNASINNDAEQDDNDGNNISALLPGLQDYADGSTAEPDFGAIFGSGGDVNVDDFSTFVTDQDNKDKPQESMFDDMMDFNFDMSGEGDNAAQDFDFDFTT
ncbi:hypothetical protein B0A48_16613 [Cryoendolithus antarcticus]|uniref:Uncharacterized protein n=1 Tax=Cryoendolithus antarcticus TaxID=1507870 RepID=A0A1V8SE70_9PEZI|nr:hypothetical protein B0A48_16613 [Cryoendolithus antarcticus]